MSVFNAIFNNINSVMLWLSVLLLEETGGPGGIYWSATRHWQTVSHNHGCIEYIVQWVGLQH